MPQKPKVYKWATAHDWLFDYLDALAENGDIPRLLREVKQLALKLDSDTIQDEYQDNMDADGYFDESSVP